MRHRTIPDNPVAYEEGKQRRIRANARIGRERRFKAAYPELYAWFFPTDADKPRGPEGFPPEWLWDAVMEWGGLTEKQAAVAIKIMNGNKEREAKRAAERAERQANATPWTPGRQDVTATILSTREEEGEYGVSIKGLFQTADGAMLWMTVPAAIGDTYRWDKKELRGKVVSFRVTVTPSKDDPTFGFGKRPTVRKATS